MKRKDLILLGIFVSLSFVFMLSFSSAAIILYNPANFTNYTNTNVFFNVSFANGTDIVTPLNASFYASSNGGGTWTLIGNTSANAQTSGQCNTNSCSITLNFSIADGNYSINATLYNVTGSVSGKSIVSSGNLAHSVIFDKTPPNVSTPGSPVSGSNYSSTLLLNVSVVDSSIGIVRGVFFNITNSTGSWNASYFASNPGGNGWNFTIDTTKFLDGIYNITVYANDTLNNVNSTTKAFSVRFDNTAPSISFSCSPTSVNTGDVVTCGCSGSDALSSVQTAAYTVNPSTSNTGTISTSCSVSDTAGNSGSGTFQYIVEQNVGGGSSGSSGGGSGSSVSSEKKITNTLGSINPGSSGVVKISDKDYGIKEISIIVNNPAQNVKVSVIKFAGKPASVSISKEGKVYKYLEINLTNVENKLDKAVVNVQVEKSWINSNGLDKDKVALYKFNNGKWNELNTVFSSEDTTNYYYNVELTSFSFFSIAQKDSTIVAGGNGNSTAEEIVPSGENKSNVGSWIIWIVILVIIVVIVLVLLKLRKNKKFKF